MAAPRFSPAGRLLVALLVVYGTAAGLVVWLGPSLRFAASRLPGYLKGSIAVSEHRVWEDEAEGLLKSKRELDRARDLLERSLAVEPNASTQFLLGEVLRAQGKPAEALAHYGASIELDPARAEPYLRTAKLLLDAGDAAAAGRVLDDGTIALERALRLQVPFPDGTVQDLFNRRAVAVHEELSFGLQSLSNAARSIR